MAQDTEQDFGNDKEKDRAGWPVSLIALLIAAGAAGGGYLVATKGALQVAAPKVEVTTQQAPAEVKVAATQSEATKTVETTVAASNSVEVAKTPEPAKVEVSAAPEVAPASKVEEPKAVAEVPKVEVPKIEAAPAKVEEPKAVVEAPKVEEPKVVEAAKPQETQVAVAAPEPTPETPKAVEPAPAVTPEAVAAPSFDTVRVEPTGDAVIAGRAAPGAEVVIKLGGKAIGKAVADATGAFAFVSDQPLPAGAAALSLETTVGGKTIASEQSVAVAVKGDQKSEPMVALVKPDEPTKIIQAPKASEPAGMADSVKLDAVDYDASGNIIFSGRGRPSAVVRLYIDNSAAGEVKADDAGRWMFAGTSAVSAGTHMLRADEIGADGKVSSRIELPFLREEPAKVAAAAPAAAEPVPAAEAAPVVEPAAETQVAAATLPAAAPEPSRMVIQPGNNLWKLSRQVYGKGIRYTVIYEANKDQIRNPNLIYPGQVFVMPVAQP
jgi:nucleoid-associated protein YgaU